MPTLKGTTDLIGVSDGSGWKKNQCTPAPNRDSNLDQVGFRENIACMRSERTETSLLSLLVDPGAISAFESIGTLYGVTWPLHDRSHFGPSELPGDARGYAGQSLPAMRRQSGEDARLGSSACGDVNPVHAVRQDGPWRAVLKVLKLMAMPIAKILAHHGRQSEIARTIRCLSSLDDRTLLDIGVIRSDIERLVKHGFGLDKER